MIKRILLSLGAVGLVCLYFWIYTSVLGMELPKTAFLKRRNAEWQARTNLFQRRMDKCEQTLAGIEDRDEDVYRSIYGLSVIPEELKQPSASAQYPWAAGRPSAGIRNGVARLDTLVRRTYIQSKSLDEVGLIARQTGDMISCVPAVPPIFPDFSTFNLSSPFGFRNDPVYGGTRFHSGQDFAADRGTPVYASGDGVVEKAECKFTGYGNEIVINHGYGYKSRYAHLNTMEVAEGMKVHRGERIGTIGNSGKSTGTHLHYEIEYRDNKVDPMTYMDIHMAQDEYQSMIDTRREESPNGKRSSTSELIRKRSNE